MFTLLQYHEDLSSFKIIRGQKKHLDKPTDGFNVIIDLTYNPNPIDLYVTVKDKSKQIIKDEKDRIYEEYRDRTITRDEKNEQLQDLKDSPPVKARYNSLTLNFDKMSLQELVKLIQDCDNLRRQNYIP